MSRRILRPLALAAFFVALTACQPTPERVCRYVEGFDPPPQALEENCIQTIREVQVESGEHWEQVGACLMDAGEATQTETCIAVADTIALQGLCDQLLEFADSEFGSGADSSLTSCLRRLRSARRDIDSDWPTYEGCLREASTLADVTACNQEHQRQVAEARRERVAAEREAARAERAAEEEAAEEEEGESEEQEDEPVID